MIRKACVQETLSDNAYRYPHDHADLPQRAPFRPPVDQTDLACGVWPTQDLMRDLIRLRRLSWVEDPISSVSGMRQHFKRTMRSPLLASIYANGQLVSEGNVEVFVSQGKGIFWPIAGKRLDTSYPEARLYVTGISGALHIKDVHQCSGTPLHWEFFMT